MYVTYLSKSGGLVNNCLWIDSRHKSGVICVYSKVREEDKICILVVKSVERESENLYRELGCNTGGGIKWEERSICLQVLVKPVAFFSE